MPDAHRFALSALLVLGSAVLAGLAVAVSTPRYAGARIPAAGELPWPPGAAAAERRPPFVLLYVDSHCAHCSRAAILVDSVAAARGLRAVIVTRDTPEDASAYRARLALRRPLVLDSSAALLHALGTRSVPTLVLFHADGARQLVVGLTSEARYRDTLAGFER
ncbi:MAG TPA: hypothetical protein VG432_13930 [Gemmatimonadaceae bacterium]|nr:hypothetical protein [Gemmatimonadaceae bacterium]